MVVIPIPTEHSKISGFVRGPPGNLPQTPEGLVWKPLLWRSLSSSVDSSPGGF